MNMNFDSLVQGVLADFPELKLFDYELQLANQEQLTVENF
jgi:hypothetical protein